MKKNQLYPIDLSDRQWDCIKELIPAAKPGGNPRTLDMRAVVNAILYLVVTGCQWRMLPREYPAWQSVYTYFRRWRKDGTWQRIHNTLHAQVRQKVGRHKHPTAGALDSQSVNTTQLPGVRGYDAGKKVIGRKRHILVDTLGLLLAVVVTSAALSDPAGAHLLLRRLGGGCKKLRRIWVDGTYRGQLLEWVMLHFHFVLQPVLRCEGQKGFVVLPRRWMVERTFAWLTQCRRLGKDYEVLLKVLFHSCSAHCPYANTCAVTMRIPWRWRWLERRQTNEFRKLKRTSQQNHTNISSSFGRDVGILLRTNKAFSHRYIAEPLAHLQLQKPVSLQERRCDLFDCLGNRLATGVFCCHLFL